MATFARIEQGVVAELFTPPTGLAISDCFAPELQWVDITASPGVAAEWTYDGHSFAPPAPPPPATASASISASAYFARFSAEESTAIHTATLVQPPTAESLALFNSVLLIAAASTVTLTDPLLTGRHATLVALGALTAARSATILTP